MSDVTGIQWTDHTFNPWWGCARVSPACRFCYADRDASRYGFSLWRRHGERRMLSEANWQRPLKWNCDAERAGMPAKVFCASMADVFEDHPDVAEPRRRLWGVIEATPWLRWQLLTKRPENVDQMVPWGSSWPPWVWLGTSVENQRFADQRIPVLLKISAAVRFLSCEPLLGLIDLRPIGLNMGGKPESWRVPLNKGMRFGSCGSANGTCNDNSCRHGIDWIIAGGESGPKSRLTELGWIEDVVNQCHEAGVPVFVKQLGAVLGRQFGAGPKGGDITRWPAYLQHRQFPCIAEAVSA